MYPTLECFLFVFFKMLSLLCMLGTAKLVSSIVGGLVAGVALLVILYAAIKWRRKSLPSSKL